ncbi:MAG: alpha/beta hydrolase [Chloroflexi bacterium]|nr:alpha/beta hydrolase [Chloroflexota bacterium]MDA1002670.1 alpha/beta hydrolase [Chloroflexota bacterium]
MPTFTTEDGARIHYTVRGSGDPPYVFIHGWCSNLRHFAPQAKHFARTHRVLSMDRRGHGRSSVPADGYTPAQHADDIAAIARQEGIDGAVVVGHAAGCPAALELARRHPSVARAVVMIDHGIYPRGALDLGPLVARLEGANGGREFRKNYESYFSSLAEPAVAQTAVDEAARTPLAVAVAELRGLAPGTQAAAKAMKQPLLMISANPVDHDGLRKVVKGIQFGTVVGSGHFPQLEVPDQVNAMIGRFASTV